jgi:hypothetical protein
MKVRLQNISETLMLITVSNSDYIVLNHLMIGSNEFERMSQEAVCGII